LAVELVLVRGPLVPAVASTCLDRADNIRDHATDLSGSDHVAASAEFERSAEAHAKCMSRGMDDYGAQVDALATDWDNAYSESVAAGSPNCRFINNERAVINNALSSAHLTPFDIRGLKQRRALAADYCS
jgi:hypothetical protein